MSVFDIFTCRLLVIIDSEDVMQLEKLIKPTNS